MVLQRNRVSTRQRRTKPSQCRFAGQDRTPSQVKIVVLRALVSFPLLLQSTIHQNESGARCTRPHAHSRGGSARADPRLRTRSFDWLTTSTRISCRCHRGTIDGFYLDVCSVSGCGPTTTQNARFARIVLAQITLMNHRLGQWNERRVGRLVCALVHTESSYM